MVDRTPRTRTSLAAGILILGLTALFVPIGIDLALDALDPSRLDRETYFSAVGFGLNQQETQNLLGLTAILILGLSALTMVLGIGVLRRREGVRHAAIGTFVMFAVVTFALSTAELLSEEVAPTVAIALVIGAIDAAIVYLLLHPRTSADFERAEDARERVRAARAAARIARRASRASERG
jgi:hypothetical protein